MQPHRRRDPDRQAADQRLERISLHELRVRRASLMPEARDVYDELKDQRHTGPNPAQRLFMTTARMSPDRLILGSIEGIEAYTWLQVMNVGLRVFSISEFSGVENNHVQTVDLC